MPTIWCNVQGINKLHARWRTLKHKDAVVVLGGVLDPADVEKLVDFVRTTLQGNDYKTYIDPRELEEENPIATAYCVFRRYVRSGRLSRFEMVCGEESDLRGTESVLEAYSARAAD